MHLLKQCRKWKWPWQRGNELTGERIITLNNPLMNDDYCSNFVSTSKYNMISFLPKFLTEQFSKYANLFFLFTACIQQIPGVSPTNQYTTIVPLALVLLASAFKEVQEDLVCALRNTFVAQKWKDLCAGNIVCMESDEFIPADLVLISSSEPEGLCYIETSNLDGETNLKIKQASPQTYSLTSASLASALHGTLRSEQPNNSLYTYEGTLELLSNMNVSKTMTLSPDQMLLRGAQLRNTLVYRIFVIPSNANLGYSMAPIRHTAVEHQVNIHIIFLYLLALSLGSTIGTSINTWFLSDQQWFIFSSFLWIAAECGIYYFYLILSITTSSLFHSSSPWKESNSNKPNSSMPIWTCT
ncbi:hypothetical protein BDR04DRAFT_1183266, partial [Suillus decipiens]